MFQYISWTDVWLVILFTFVFCYLSSHYRYGYWRRKGVYSPPATFPSGHVGDVLLGRRQLGLKLSEIYEANKHRPYVGLFLIHVKTLMIHDLDLIKNVLVKDFAHFPDHGLGYSKEGDPLSKHLFNMEGDEWREIRAKLSVIFTSSKMKYMFRTVVDCAKNLERDLERQVMSGKDVDFKETLAKYGTDVIGSCAFGIETNSFKYPDAEFRQMGKKIFSNEFVKTLREMLAFFAPSFVSTFKIRIIAQDIEDFFVKTIKYNIEYREKNNIVKNDFIQLMIDLKKKDEEQNIKSLDIYEITAQCYLFFIGGFETSSTTASFALYELAKNPEIQEKLRTEIYTVLKRYDGNLTYESLAEMEYLTQVIEETLRMYPPLPFLFRRCVKDYQVPNTDFTIDKGTFIALPIFGIQRDPNIHEDPLIFRPERFSTEGKASMKHYSSIPFGEGPRICIGSRFGMMQTKLGIISTLSKYEVAVSENTTIPMVFEPRMAVLCSKNEQYLKVTKRRI